MQFPKNLSQLKKYFSEGGRVTLVEHVYVFDGKENDVTSQHKYANITRKALKVQSNCVYLGDENMGESRLEWGKAANWSFDPVTKQVIDDSGWSRLTYVLNDAA